MDSTDTITETSNAGAIDLTEARRALETAKADVAERERAIVSEELRQAEAAHADLLAQCKAAQAEFDRIDGEVEQQHHVFLQSLTRRNGAVAHLDAEQRNAQTPGWDHGRVVSGGEQAARQARLAECAAECKEADKNHAKEMATMSTLQGKRRVAVQELEALSWETAPVGVRVNSLRTKLAALTPRIVPAVAPPWTPPEFPETQVLELTASGLRTLPDAVGPRFK